MSEKEKPIDARLDVIERRILMQGETPEEWAVEVSQPVKGVWTTTFYVGPQSFQLANCSNNEIRPIPGGRGAQLGGAEEHCMFIGQMFAKAIGTVLRSFQSDLVLLRSVIVRASDLLFDSRIDDPQHQVDCHADTLPKIFLKLSAGHEAALETLQTLVREWVEPHGLTQQELLAAGVGVRLGDFATDLQAAMEGAADTEEVDVVPFVRDANEVPVAGKSTHRERLLGLQGHCAKCGAAIGVPCRIAP